MSSKAVYSMFFISTEALKCNRSTVNRRVTRMSHLSASCFSEILVFFIFFALFRPLLVGVVHWHPFLGCHLAIGLALNFCSATHKTRATDLFNCWIITFIIIIVIKSIVRLKCDNLAGVIHGIKIKPVFEELKIWASFHTSSGIEHSPGVHIFQLCALACLHSSPPCL